MKTWKKYAVRIMLLLIILLTVLELTGMICPPELLAVSEGEPKCVTRQDDLLFTGISQIAADGERIYVLYGTYSVVQAYTQEGAYLYSLSVYNHSSGHTRIATRDGNLYIRDKIGNIYCFSGDRFTEFVPNTAADHPAAQLSYNSSAQGYTVRWGSVENETGETVIARPAIMALYHNGMISGLQFFLILGIGFVLAFGRLSGDRRS